MKTTNGELVRSIAQLLETNPAIEGDDYLVGFMMVSVISGAVPELKAQYLAQWAARLREYYIQIGFELGKEH